MQVSMSHWQAREATPDPNIDQGFLVKGPDWCPYESVLQVMHMLLGSICRIRACCQEAA